MSAFAAFGLRPWSGPVWAGVLMVLATVVHDPAFAESASAGAPIVVHLDEAKVLKVPEKTTTLVVGNPLIADVTAQPGGIMVVTAKSFGVTNLVALDRNGVTLMEHPIQVLGPPDNVVVLYRGIERESYSCMPNCERRIMLGDSANYFAAIMTQSTIHNTQAQGGPAR